MVIFMPWDRIRKSPNLTTNPSYTVDGRNPANHLGCIKPCNYWDKLPIN